MTCCQAVELGAHVRKGEKGSPVVYANSITRNETDTDSRVDVARDIHFLKGYTVFKVEQSKDCPRSTVPIHGSSTRLSVQLPAPVAVDPAESVSRMAQANASFG